MGDFTSGRALHSGINVSFPGTDEECFHFTLLWAFSKTQRSLVGLRTKLIRGRWRRHLVRKSHRTLGLPSTKEKGGQLRSCFNIVK